MTAQLSRPATYRKAILAAAIAVLAVLKVAARSKGISLDEALDAVYGGVLAGGAVFGVGNAD